MRRQCLSITCKGLQLLSPPPRRHWPVRLSLGQGPPSPATFPGGGHARPWPGARCRTGACSKRGGLAGGCSNSGGCVHAGSRPASSRPQGASEGAPGSFGAAGFRPPSMRALCSPSCTLPRAGSEACSVGKTPCWGGNPATGCRPGAPRAPRLGAHARGGRAHSSCKAWRCGSWLPALAPPCSDTCAAMCPPSPG